MMKEIANNTNNDGNVLKPYKWWMLPKWGDLPNDMRIPEVRKYYDALSRHRFSLILKRIFDIFVSLILIVVLCIPMIIIAILITLDSPGPVMFRQERVTTYGQIFRIHKFRTMINHADKIGAGLTISDDKRITKIGEKLRASRIDELPQLFDVLEGTMSFVGTRPELVKYAKCYTNEMMATFLLPAGITSEASIRYKNESSLLSNCNSIDKVYVEEILPAKMVWNLESIMRFSFPRELLTMVRTIAAVCGKNYY